MKWDKKEQYSISFSPVENIQIRTSEYIGDGISCLGGVSIPLSTGYTRRVHTNQLTDRTAVIQHVAW
jgi:hypothetical protein